MTATCALLRFGLPRLPIGETPEISRFPLKRPVKSICAAHSKHAEIRVSNHVGILRPPLGRRIGTSREEVGEFLWLGARWAPIREFASGLSRFTPLGLHGRDLGHQVEMIYRAYPVAPFFRGPSGAVHPKVVARIAEVLTVGFSPRRAEMRHGATFSASSRAGPALASTSAR